MNTTRHTLDWNLPLLPAITQRLLDSADGDFVDLSSALVIVPTVQSGRRLRECLALAVAKQGRGLFPPEIVTPDVLLGQAIKDQAIASEATVTAAWVTVLGAIDATQFTALLPIAPQQSTGWQIGMAQRLMQLRNELGEEGLDFTLAAQRAADAGHETERWRQLARLEGLYLDQLHHRGLQDPKQARRAAAHTYQAPAHLQRIILAASPDPQPLSLHALRHAAASVAVEVWIYAAEAAHFDAWGRPLTDHWTQRPLDLEGWNCRLQTVASPQAAAALISQSLRDKAPESVLVGLADPNLNPIVVDTLQQAQLASYDPEGQALHIDGVGRLSELLCQLCESPDITTVRTLLQHPDILQWLGLEALGNELLRQIDRLFGDHLTPDLRALIDFAARKANQTELQRALGQLDALASKLSAARNFPEALAAALQDIYAKQQIQTHSARGIPWKERAEAIRKLLEHAAEAQRLFPQLPKDFSRSAWRHSLTRSRVYPDRPSEAHDLLGWLELLWNDAPHLILAGLNEGIVPESIVGDAFLPETLRVQLGLRSNAQRFARDAYLLEALCRRRAAGQGHIDILVPQAAHDQTPLKPSRLLFLGAPATLLRRTRQLFQATEAPGARTEHRAAWQLSPPPGLQLPATLSVSALKSYLECPFRFFLRHILKMRPLDTQTRELSPAAFGELVHDTLAELKGQHLDPSLDRETLRNQLQRIAERMLTHRYGAQRSFALQLQREALMARIAAFCTCQLEDLQANGRTTLLDTEQAFELSLQGVTINGRIDRIDQRGERLELIDYKTSNTPISPDKAHLATVARKAPPPHLPDAALFEHEGKTYRWTDLQLPLYQLAHHTGGGERPTLAYFNLAQTQDKSGIVRWDGFTASHLDSARACAAAIIQQIQAGKFWPPNPSLSAAYDDFAALFPDGIENSVNREAFENYTFQAAADAPLCLP